MWPDLVPVKSHIVRPPGVTAGSKAIKRVDDWVEPVVPQGFKLSSLHVGFDQRPYPMPRWAPPVDKDWNTNIKAGKTKVGVSLVGGAQGSEGIPTPSGSQSSAS